ncbi:MAG: HD domain-containing protein [Bacteroidia bacterium]|nr:HD domain-containing protein [Bacteroidia bacterium]
MEPLDIILKYYKPESKSYDILVNHSRLVADKALKIASNHANLKLDLIFIEQAAMLHDIGIFLSNAPDLGCYGKLPYICHGYLGYELLEKEGYPKHGLVCERHTGIGITKEEVVINKLPLPNRDFVPISLEEQLICFTDKFYSKSGDLFKEKSIDQIVQSMTKFGPKNLQQFRYWCEFFL